MPKMKRFVQKSFDGSKLFLSYSTNELDVLHIYTPIFRTHCPNLFYYVLNALKYCKCSRAIANHVTLSKLLF